MPQVTCTTENGILDYAASFGEDHCHVSMDRLLEGRISTSFGDYTVDLTEVEEIEEHCSIDTSCSFGELTLLVPKRYRVHCQNSTSFASVEFSGKPDDAPQGNLSISTDVSFGSVNIKYV